MEPTYTTRWLYSAHTSQAVSPGRNTCAICGLPTAAGKPPTAVLRDTFTDYAALRQPRSATVCAACDWYMSRQDLRRSSWWLTETAAAPIERVSIRSFLLDQIAHPPPVAGYILITATRRKHLALYAPLNAAGASTRRLRFETATLDIDPATFPALVAAVDALRQHHTWQEIATGVYYPANLAKWPTPAAFTAAFTAVRPWLRTPHLNLIRFISTKEAITADETDTD